METSEFKEKIQELIRSAKTEEALDLLLEESKSLGGKHEHEITLLKSRFSKIERDRILGLAPSWEIQIEINNVHHSILSIVEKMHRREDVISMPLPVFRKYRWLLFGGGFLIVSLSGIFWFVSQFASNSKCSEVKKSAEETLHRVVESKKNNSDTFDELKYIFLEEVLRNHIHLTSCDSTDAILRDIETANKFLKKHGK